MLVSTLKWLARPEVLRAPQCSMVVGPDPRRFPPIPPHAGAEYRQYRLRFTVRRDDIGAELEADSSFFAYADNLRTTPSSSSSCMINTQHSYTKIRPPHIIENSNDLHTHPGPEFHSSTSASRWVSLVDIEVADADDRTLRESVLDLLDIFPHYDLTSASGVEEAILDMRQRMEFLTAKNGTCHELEGLVGANHMSAPISHTIFSSEPRQSRRDNYLTI